jgi:uncharacterized membrane protein YdjX (TVP38/TMEM64 family)
LWIFGKRTLEKPIPLSIWLRVSAFVLLLLAGFVFFRFTAIGNLLAEDRLIALINDIRSVWWSPLLLIGLYVLMGPLGLPTGPLLMGGAAFGAFYGTLYNLTGLLIGAALCYQVAFILGRDFVFRVAGRRLQRAQRFLEHRGFWPMVQTRFLPIPFAAVNFGAALAGVRASLFLGATVVGLIPSTLIHTYFIAELFSTQGSERVGIFALYAASFAVFNLFITLIWVRREARWRQFVSHRISSLIRLALFRLDGFLRRKQGIFEFWDDPKCLFRASLTHTLRPLPVSGGEIPAGAKMLELHFWNENIPPVPSEKADLAWAARLYRTGLYSLRTLGDQLSGNPCLSDVKAVGGVTPLFFPGDGSAWEKIFSRMGFDTDSHKNPLGVFGEFWQVLYAWLLIWSFTPSNAKRRSLLQTRRTDFWMSAEDFIARYACPENRLK